MEIEKTLSPHSLPTNFSGQKQFKRHIFCRHWQRKKIALTEKVFCDGERLHVMEKILSLLKKVSVGGRFDAEQSKFRVNFQFKKSCVISYNFLFLLQTPDFALIPFQWVLLSPSKSISGDQWITTRGGGGRKVVFYWQKLLLLVENRVWSQPIYGTCTFAPVALSHSNPLSLVIACKWILPFHSRVQLDTTYMFFVYVYYFYIPPFPKKEFRAGNNTTTTATKIIYVQIKSII